MKHLRNDFEIALEQERVLGNKEISALLTETGNINTTSAGV